MASRTTPFDIQTIPGYPDSLQIYRIPASSSWQVRMFVDRKYVRRSTGTSDRREAVEFAKSLFDTIRINQRLDISVHTDTFHACAQHLIRQQDTLVATGQRGERINTEDSKKLKADILPFFGAKGVAAITSSMIDEYIAELGKRKKLSPSTLSKHLIVIRKVLKEALKRGYLKSIPPFPAIRKKDTPRPYFTIDEYRQLRKVTRLLSAEIISVSGHVVTEEIYDLIVFGMNVFIRPSDIKLLRHRDIEVVRDRRNDKTVEYLSIMAPNSKTVIRESLTMPTAAMVYQRIKSRQTAQGYGKSDDFVFYPYLPDRAYALTIMRKQFEFALKRAELRKDRLGRNRTLYSLRHSALMYRFLLGKNIDIFTLARNALTSVSQLERFYLSHAASRDKIENLHSFR